MTKRRGLDGAFASPPLKSAIRLAVRAAPRKLQRKSAKAVTGDVPAKLLTTCSTGSLRDLRDRAILMVAFASGGRRRSEIAGLRVEQLTEEAPIGVADAPPLPSLAIHLGRTKTTSGEEDDVVYLKGRPAGEELANLVVISSEFDAVQRFQIAWNDKLIADGKMSRPSGISIGAKT